MSAGWFVSVVVSMSLAVVACGGGGKTSGTGGGSGGPDGSGGAGGSGSGNLAPCRSETDYEEGATVMFPGATIGYRPSCLKISMGQSVTFAANMVAASFVSHPLMPSAIRGDVAGNPITAKESDETMATFTFPARGHFGFYCRNHGTDADGGGMTGMIWVQ